MPAIEIAAEKLFYFMGFPITNTLLMSWVVVIFLITLSQLISRNIRKVPEMLQNIAESGAEALLNMMEGVLHSREKAEKFFPLIATIFTLILVSNWFGIIPGVGSIGFHEMHDGVTTLVPLLRSSASDLNFTLSIAVLSVLLLNVYAIRELGLKVHISKFFNFKNPVLFFVGLLELVSEFAKIVSFSFRLFGNIFAGEVLLIITGFLAPFLAPIPFLMLEIFVGFVQALVFAMLTLVFLSIAVEEHAEH